MRQLDAGDDVQTDVSQQSFDVGLEEGASEGRPRARDEEPDLKVVGGAADDVEEVPVGHIRLDDPGLDAEL
jgi:hypothetical protein